MNSEKRREFIDDHLIPAAEASRNLRIDTGAILNQSVLLATSALFLMLAGIVFLLPLLAPDDVAKIARISTLVVFLFGPLGEVVAVYPLYTEAAGSIREIYRVEERLQSISRPAPLDTTFSEEPPRHFEAIRCEKITFEYHDEKGEKSFSLEPVDFELRRGEMVFITGGNGSGKSTFLKVFAGLYPPTDGRILLDDLELNACNIQSYRNLIGAVFSDFHLFERLYGLNLADPSRVLKLLSRLELTGKISIADRQISTLSLSTGQQKRVALLVALLEDRPILLFDEWAAEQDPPFRRKFYEEILPELKAGGKTILAITHDDDFYHVADRVLKMQYGKFIESSPPKRRAPQRKRG
jgi:putative pyoverdin transport system ATP-binding/permease protein